MTGNRTSSNRYRILIADDHPIVREGFSALIALQSDFELVGVANNGQEAVDFCARHPVDVVLSDLRMPVMDGVTAIREIKKNHPEIRILVLTSFIEDDLVIAAIRGGASGYLLKDVDPDTLVQAIREVAMGEIYLPKDIARKLMREIREPRQDMVADQADRTDKSQLSSTLTPREIETLCLLARSLTNVEIAMEMCISERTVAKYVSNILRKLVLKSRTHAAMYALKEGIVDLSDCVS